MKNRWKDVTTVVNLTPHEISVMVGDSIKRIPPSGKVVRVNSQCEPCGLLNGIPVVHCSEGIVRGLPDEEVGTVYLVSSVVAKAVNRKDILCPDTSDEGVIRDGNGFIVAVKRLQCFYY